MGVWFAGLRAHNRWLADFCADALADGRDLRRSSLDDVDAAVTEVRWAREAGLEGRAVAIGSHAQEENLYYPRYDRVGGMRGTGAPRPPSCTWARKKPEEAGPASTWVSACLKARSTTTAGLPSLVRGSIRAFSGSKYVTTETSYSVKNARAVGGVGYDVPDVVGDSPIACSQTS